MKLNPQEVHIWIKNLSSATLGNAETNLNQLFEMLDQDEKNRATRFHLPIHSERFIIAHASLRKILSLYLDNNPNTICFGQTAYKKPFIASENPQELHFNLSHSENMAVIAITMGTQVGIDIEAMQPNPPLSVAKRYFKPDEYAALINAPTHDQSRLFYRLWSRKEAIIKANGKGMAALLGEFTVAAHEEKELITLENEAWILLTLTKSSNI
jgi:4'-phosphopantetheinyl transferase